MPPTLRIPTMKWNPPMFGARDIAYWISRLMATVDAAGTVRPDGHQRTPPPLTMMLAIDCRAHPFG